MDALGRNTQFTLVCSFHAALHTNDVAVVQYGLQVPAHAYWRLMLCLVPLEQALKLLRAGQGLPSGSGDMKVLPCQSCRQATRILELVPASRVVMATSKPKHLLSA